MLSSIEDLWHIIAGIETCLLTSNQLPAHCIHLMWSKTISLVLVVLVIYRCTEQIWHVDRRRRRKKQPMQQNHLHTAAC